MTLVGALEVPGGNVGSNVKLNRPADSRQKSAVKGPDGFMEYPFNETTKTDWEKDPSIRNAFKTLVPLAANSAWSPALGPAHLPWLFQKKAPSNWPTPTKPDIWFCYRTNPAISSGVSSLKRNSIKKAPICSGVALPAKIIVIAVSASLMVRGRELLLPRPRMRT